MDTADKLSEFELSVGALHDVLMDKELSKPIFQILGFRKITAQGMADKYRVHLSDGKHSHTFTVLGPQYNDWINDGRLDCFAVIQCDKIATNMATDGRQKVILILELTVLHKGDEVKGIIGKPQPYKFVEPPHHLQPDPVEVCNTIQVEEPPDATQYPVTVDAQEQTQDTHPNPLKRKHKSEETVALVPNPAYSMFESFVIPIRDVTPYSPKCTLKARVTRKSPIKFWNNVKGEGKLFSLELLDDSGEIRLTGFTSAVEAFYDAFEENQIYFFQNFQVKLANKQYSNINNEYELQFTSDTKFLICLENTKCIPEVSFRFTEIASIEQVPENSFVDVVGICKSVGELTLFTSKLGKEFIKRDIHLVDRSNTEITLTLWDKTAREFTDDSNPVVAAKRVKVSDFSGKSLSLPSSSLLQINPDLEETHSLRQWYTSEGCKLQPRSLSVFKLPLTSIIHGTSLKLLSEARSVAEALPADKFHYFTSKVMIMSCKQDNMMYKACPAPDCKKKVEVIQNKDGRYRCDKCEQEFPDFKWRILLQIEFADCTGSLWATCFHEIGQQILGKDSDELGMMYTDCGDALESILKKILFEPYTVKFKTRIQNYNGENRLKSTVIDLHLIDYAEDGKKLLTQI